MKKDSILAIALLLSGAAHAQNNPMSSPVAALPIV
jgi:hypothetical protein